MITFVEDAAALVSTSRRDESLGSVVHTGASQRRSTGIMCRCREPDRVRSLNILDIVWRSRACVHERAAAMTNPLAKVVAVGSLL